jgi:hypothetical protein
MTSKNFRHINPDEYHGKELTLHDCIANKIAFENNILSFCLPDGFWVTPHHKENSYEKTVRTDASVVDFSIKDIDDAMVYVFTRHRWLWFRKANMEIWDMEQLIALVNSEKCTLEFITQYKSHYEQMWHCAIRSNKKPYYRECQLYLPETEATFFWNDLRPDREW